MPAAALPVRARNHFQCGDEQRLPAAAHRSGGFRRPVSAAHGRASGATAAADHRLNIICWSMIPESSPRACRRGSSLSRLRHTAAARAICIGVAIAMLAACSDAASRLEAARAACLVTIQSLYRPISDKDPVAFEPVANVAADNEKFEFVWKQSQIKNLTFVLLPQEIE